MKSKIFNVSLTRDVTNLSYPIIVGEDLLRNGGEILKEFIYKKKIIVIHDSIFSINNNPSNSFVQFIQSIKKLTSSVSGSSKHTTEYLLWEGCTGICLYAFFSSSTQAANSSSGSCCFIFLMHPML